ncbi:hypothetical protein J41TS2_45780 [Bacillus sonorensis]|nr:hypothetical protein J41TS2_45780 [Bacillus sonorensis]
MEKNQETGRKASPLITTASTILTFGQCLKSKDLNLNRRTFRLSAVDSLFSCFVFHISMSIERYSFYTDLKKEWNT